MKFPAPDLTAPSAVQAASTLAVANALPVPLREGLGITIRAGAVGLVRSLTNVHLPPNPVVGLIDDYTGELINTNDLARGFLASGYLPILPDVVLSFTPALPQFACYYTSDLVFIANLNSYAINAGTYHTPPNAAYMRVSADNDTVVTSGIKYSAATYSLGNLPYVRTVNGQLPDGDGSLYLALGSLATLLAGYVKGATNRALAATDSVLVAFGVLEKRADDNTAAIAANAAAINALASQSSGVVVARAVNFYATGVPDVALPDLQSQIDWLFRHLGTATPPAQQTIAANSATPS